jgi:protein Tex
LDILQQIQNEFNIKKIQVENTVKLIDEGNTIPFISRYRKELTGSLDDQILREIYERLNYLRNLEERREQVRNKIIEQGKITEEITKRLNIAKTLTDIEDIYRPFKQKRKTKATIAKDKGLEPLAIIMWQQVCDKSLEQIATEYLNEEKEVATVKDALNGAMDIVAEIISDDPNYRKLVRDKSINSGVLNSKAVNSKEKSVYEMYYDFDEEVKSIASHRVLALNRGEKEKLLKVNLNPQAEDIIAALKKNIVKNNKYTELYISLCVEDAYKRLIEPSIEREVRNMLTEKAEDGAMKVFSANLKQLLLQAPIKDKVVLALDPGFRTGCKVALIDGTGKVLETGVVYPTPPQSKIEESKAILINWVNKYNVDIIAIGNGTASRETEAFVSDMIKEITKKVFYVIVNEAGASVYSASKLASVEFPGYDVALRSAISIARRLQDPLAELVKIDPKSIGVGQYQHDMNEKKLDENLGGVVEACVNTVGVDLNTASTSLLSYVSGVTPSIAKNILEYREEVGKFKNRKELLKVKKLGKKAYKQCAGFLRIQDGNSPLDNTSVHPETYDITETFLKEIGYCVEDIKLKKINNIKTKVSSLDEIAANLNVGVPTLVDIINELEKPGRDPREDMPEQILRSDILSMQDLKEGMIMQGTVRNVIDFGVFVDIGVHQDGLVHISQIADKFIKHPLEAVSVGDTVTVRVISIDINSNRIALSMKNIK